MWRGITWGEAIKSSCTVWSSRFSFSPPSHQGLVENQGQDSLLLAGGLCFSVFFLIPPNIASPQGSTTCFMPCGLLARPEVWCQPGFPHLSSHCVLLKSIPWLLPQLRPPVSSCFGHSSNSLWPPVPLPQGSQADLSA